jgi:hypothetical protein
MTGTEGCSPCTIHAAVKPATGTSSANGTTRLVAFLASSAFQIPKPTTVATSTV